MITVRPLLWCPVALLGAAVMLSAIVSCPAAADVLEIPASFSVGPPRGSGGDGLTMRFKDNSNECSLLSCQAATDTITVNTTTMPNVNFLLNQNCSIGPFYHACGYFWTRWDSYLDIRTPGDYMFSMQVDDQGEVAIGDSTILKLDGSHWYANVTSDTIRFSVAGSYPVRMYYADCQPCCRGFRLGGMGPEGSDMMAFTEGFDFNADLGPCCTYGGNGPGLSVIPADLFFLSPTNVGVDPGALEGTGGSIVRAWTSPNPSRGTVRLAVELAREQRLWVEVFDAAGRRLDTLAGGTRFDPGVARWSWSPVTQRVSGPASGTFFYRVRSEDGSLASGRFTSLR